MGKIAVIGDVMLDKYRYCTIRNINPEHKTAPCYIVRSKEYRPGGAGNSAANLISLEADFKLIGIVGNDPYSGVLEQVLANLGVNCDLIKDPKRHTIIKERIFVNDQYQNRIDEEETGDIEENHVKEVLGKLGDSKLIIISDYRKGMISSRLMDQLRLRNIPMVVDAKPEHMDFYENLFLVKPNSREAREMTGINDEMLAGEALMKKLNSNILLTRGVNGISYFGTNGERYDFPGRKVKEVDVVGAGDSVLATFAHFFTKGHSIEDCVRLANIAGGISVQYPGCHPVSEKEIFDAMKREE